MYDRNLEGQIMDVWLQLIVTFVISKDLIDIWTNQNF